MDELLNAVVELPVRERIGQGYTRGPEDDLKVTRESLGGRKELETRWDSQTRSLTSTVHDMSAATRPWLDNQTLPPEHFQPPGTPASGQQRGRQLVSFPYAARAGSRFQTHV